MSASGSQVYGEVAGVRPAHDLGTAPNFHIDLSNDYGPLETAVRACIRRDRERFGAMQEAVSRGEWDLVLWKRNRYTRSREEHGINFTGEWTAVHAVTLPAARV